MKANHNANPSWRHWTPTVSNGSKILKWKQITTHRYEPYIIEYCFQWFKDTKMKANHNKPIIQYLSSETVSNGSKILKWKQITTGVVVQARAYNCFQWFKDTKMKANHNWRCSIVNLLITVSNGSKILKWKQITTKSIYLLNMLLLFPMVQRY